VLKRQKRRRFNGRNILPVSKKHVIYLRNVVNILLSLALSACSVKWLFYYCAGILFLSFFSLSYIGC
jgi:hypothetical protein